MSDTTQFESPKELARHLYEKAVEPGDTTATRVYIASMASRFALDKWEEYGDTE